MLFDVLFFPVTSVAWLGEQIRQRADAEFDSQENLHKRLLALQLSYDMGEISEADFEAQEEALLKAIIAAEAQDA